MCESLSSGHTVDGREIVRLLGGVKPGKSWDIYHMGVSKNRGKTPKMDGEYNGKPC